MNEPIETINYKGYDINIYQDENAESPEEMSGGDEGLFLVGYHRDFTIDRGRYERIPITIYKTEDFKENNGYDGRVYEDRYGWKSYEEAKKEGLLDKQTTKQGNYVVGISKNLARAIVNGGKDEDGEINYDAKEYIKKYHIFGLEAYIHSGVVLALSYEGNFCDRQWDVSQLGLVFVSKKEARTKKSAKELALGLIREWNDYLSGSVYGYVIKFKEGDEDSCWGYYGDTEYMIKECKSIIDNYIKRKQEENNKRLKTLIKNKVPLNKRVLEKV
uniref:Uncharacterized protein n=1 Tax=viral metagenome TaxID=1070528 RepID=A0A6M3JGW1_9ZZZZ